MDKNAIKKYAVWARRELISRVSQRAAQYEITADGYGDQNAASVHGSILSADEKKQRAALIAQIKEKGYEQVMEEIAYTWFNRFSALRFMEVNGYLPTRVRVFTDDENNFKPQILIEAINMELDGLDMQKVYDLKNANDDDALFKYMIIVQCNALSKILPGMFQRISDYTELLFPDNLLREGSVVEQMIVMIPQEDWTDQVQIIGWLYQYYNSEPKDQVFANLKKNIKISKENIPAATQLFTPDWIVRYMVENSLGRLWLEGHPNDDLKAEWKYYLDEAEQEPEVQAQLSEIRMEYAALKPEDILAIDPCQGSGHILAYMFDVLVQIYEAYGYSAREAAASIVEHNIWGLDIDERAAQLAYFSVMMKARQYDRRFFSRGIQPHIYAILESNNLDPHCIEYFVDGRKELKSAMDTLVKELHDAKEYGSILNVTKVNFEALYSRFDEIQNEIAPGINSYYAIDTLLPFVQVAQAMAQKYDIVCTNPPYMGGGNMNKLLNDYAKKNYPASKSDMSTIFMEKTLEMCTCHGFMAMINIPVWMFLSSYEKLRDRILSTNTIVNMVHPGRGIFGSDFGTTSFVFREDRIKGFMGIYCRLFDEQVEVKSPEYREEQFLSGKGRYTATQDMYSRIPGEPIAYWISNNGFEAFTGDHIVDHYVVRNGISTGDNERYLRLWYEVNKKADYWKPCNKGGAFRKWYGNNDYRIFWKDNGYDIRTSLDEKGRIKARLGGIEYSFSNGIEMSRVTTGALAFRYSGGGFVYESSTNDIYQMEETWELMWLLAYCNSKVASYFLNLMNPTINIMPEDIRKLPCPNTNTKLSNEIAKQCVRISKADWDSFETSWDFQKHPFIRIMEETANLAINKEKHQETISSIEMCWKIWEAECADRFCQLKEYEEENNRFFIEFYNLQNELTAVIEDESVSVHKADLKRDIRGFISYAVGCMFGRYSLLIPGLIYAGGEWPPLEKASGIRESNYSENAQGIISMADTYGNYIPDKDGIIPISDDEYFTDDIVGQFVKFVEVVYGIDMLEENLRFIADSLGGKGSSREVIRNYFINDFYLDHVKAYQKRPIYWLFDSGKRNGFKCLVYMHRYQPDTIARIRTDYVHEQQSRYRTAIADLESRIANAGTGERVKLQKKLDSVRGQAEELRVYEEKIHHLADQMIRIDLDDGVKVNYAKFQDVLVKLK